MEERKPDFPQLINSITKVKRGKRQGRVGAAKDDDATRLHMHLKHTEVGAARLHTAVTPAQNKQARTIMKKT